MTQYNNSAIATIGMLEDNAAEFVIILAETLGVSEATVSSAVFPLLDKIGVSEVLDTLIKAQINLADGMGLNDAFNFFIEFAIADTIGLQEAPSAYKRNAIIVIDAMVLTGVATNRIAALNALVAIVGLVEGLEKGFPGDILDTIGLTEDALRSIRAAGITTDELGLSDDLLETISIYFTADDTVGLKEDLSFNQTLQGLLDDGMSFAVTLLGPGSAVYTGWVMNSENMAMTTYKNYEFTDLARIAGKYYGVKEDGLFLLEGGQDDSTFIKAIIRSAKMELGTSNLKTLTKAYIGFTGDGTLVLKIVTDEKEETWYNVSPGSTDLQTTRVGLAKGQIGRYWQFEIIADDSTYLELDSVELFPIVFKRKV